MTRPLRRWLLATTLVVGLYLVLDLALSQVLLQLLPQERARALQRGGSGAEVLRLEADALARDSAASEAVLPTTSRADAFWAGHQVGVASQWQALAVVAQRQDPAAALAQARAIANQGGTAVRLGLAPLQPLVSSTLGQSSQLPQRIEADEGGQVAALRRATSLRHAHLYLLGFHAGAHAYSRVVAPAVEAVPQAALIERHAVLAGVPAALWRPLAETPAGATPELRRDAYLAAVRQLMQALGGIRP